MSEYVVSEINKAWAREMLSRKALAYSAKISISLSVIIYNNSLFDCFLSFFKYLFNIMISLPDNIIMLMLKERMF